MARLNVNLGTPPSGADGDPVRSAFEKVNTMTQEIYTILEGLRSASRRNVGIADGEVMIISPSAAVSGNAAFSLDGSRFTSYLDGVTIGQPPGAPNCAGIRSRFADGSFAAVDIVGTVYNGSPTLFWQSINGAGATQGWRKLYDTGNTTLGSGGAIIAASPIVRIANVAKSERPDLLSTDFTQGGDWGVCNSESEGCTTSRTAVGEYKISGSKGLALEGWRVQDPKSPDGGKDLGITETSIAKNGDVIVKLFKQRWSLNDDGEMVLGKGVPIDVPLNSWIDVRLEMPKKQE